MYWILVLCFPAYALAQFGLPADKPLHQMCGHRNFDPGRFPHETLDAESLHSYDQLTLALDLRVEHADVPLIGTATLTLVARENLTAIPLNAENLTVTEVRLNGQIATYTYSDDTLFVNAVVAANDTAIVSISYSAAPNPDWNDTGYQTGYEQAYTFSEPYGARRWYPCWDQPGDKFSSIQTRVNMPDHWSLAANGSRIAADFPEAGRKRETYEHDSPISPYLVSIAAGLFAKTEFVQDGVQYRYYVWPWDSLPAAYDWQRTPEMVTIFNGRFGNYPFDEYGMAATDIFGGWGAMEHQTFTTYGFNLVDSLRTFEGIVAHELAHMWFGDHLSPVDFRNMWLNEGFATYGNLLWDEHIGGEARLQAQLDQLRTYIFDEAHSHPLYPVYDPPPDRLFGVNQYYKGAWILHMLRRQLLGDEAFFEMLQDYVNTFAGGTVSTQDFVGIVNEHYDGPDVQWFFDQWVYDLGHPMLDISLQPDPGEAVLRIHVRQTQTGVGYFSFPLVIDQNSGPNLVRDTVWVGAEEWYFGMVALQGLDGRLAEDQIALFEDVTSEVDEDPAVPASFVLGAAYPNPFNPSFTVPLELSRRAIVTLYLHDITGRAVSQVYEGTLEAGRHELHFEPPAALATGVYFLRATSGVWAQTQKILLLK